MHLSNGVALPSGLFVDLYELTMGQVYYHEKPRTVATFDLFIRSYKRPFYVAGGIHEFLSYVQQLCFTRSDIDYLKGLGLFDDEYLQYLSNFRFSGEISAVREGEIVFPEEPIASVTAPLVSAQLIESAAINIVNLYTTLLTKAVRVVQAAQGRKVFDFSLRRTQGMHAAQAAAYCAYCAGAEGTSNVLAGSRYGIPVVGTMAHSYVMSFATEIESFIKFSTYFPDSSILLVDTYDTRRGIEAAIEVGKRMKKQGKILKGIRLDSGDIAREAKAARTMLDREGLIDTFIVASGDLDEYKISALIQTKAPIDAFGVGTNMGVSTDAPFTDMIYKLVECEEKNHRAIPVMKLSLDKSTLPGKKQVFRVASKKKCWKEDCIGLRNEHFKGASLLLRSALKDGQLLYVSEPLDAIRARIRQNLALLSLKPNVPARSRVRISPALKNLVEQTRRVLNRRPEDEVLFFDVDTQHDFMDVNGALYVKNARTICRAVAALTQCALKNRIRIISTIDAHARHDKEFAAFPPHCVVRTPGQQKLSGTLLHKDRRATLARTSTYSPEDLHKVLDRYQQIIVEKDSIDVFSAEALRPLIEIVSPLRVYVYGVALDYCVKTSIEGLLSFGVKVYMVKDAVKEIDPSVKADIIRQFQEKGVELVTVKQVVSMVKRLHANKGV